MNGVQGAGGSNPLVPTKIKKGDRVSLALHLLFLFYRYSFKELNPILYSFICLLLFVIFIMLAKPAFPGNTTVRELLYIVGVLDETLEDQF